MRHYYLNPAHDKGACRGGVANNWSDSLDYELEINGRCNASAELIALCVFHDEIIEHLEKSTTVGNLILNNYKNLVKKINDDLRQSKNQT